MTSGTRADRRRPRLGRGRTALAVGAALALTTLLAGCLTAAQQTEVDAVNSYRTSNGKNALAVDDAAVAKAQAWASQMATSGTVQNSAGGANVDYTGVDSCSLYENVGSGTSVDAVRQAFIANSTKKANLLATADRIGVGIAQNGSTYYVAELYARNCTASGALAISTSQTHTCALTGTGGVVCWGGNYYGQLGNGTGNDSLVPTGVSGLGSGVKGISTGPGHSCAVLTTGAVKCWGHNDTGQLGNGSTFDRWTPQQVTGITSGAVAVSAGYGYSCALMGDGTVRCWGANDLGQLGNGTTTSSLTPVTVSGLTTAKQVSAGSGQLSHTCAVTSAGAAVCWGQNGDGELGNNSDYNSSVPVSVIGLTSGVANIDVGNWHTCAVTTAGAAYCWGNNANGQLGDNSTAGRYTAATVSGLTSGVANISAGTDHTCAVTRVGAVKCWGFGYDGQLGNNVAGIAKVPVQVSGITSGAKLATTGDWTSCAILKTGQAKCWGGNGYGQLGNNTTDGALTPVSVSTLTGG